MPVCTDKFVASICITHAKLFWRANPSEEPCKHVVQFVLEKRAIYVAREQVGKLTEHARKLLGLLVGEDVCVLLLGWFKKHKQHERSLRKTILQRLFRPTNYHKNWIH